MTKAVNLSFAHLGIATAVDAVSVPEASVSAVPEADDMEIRVTVSSDVDNEVFSF